MKTVTARDANQQFSALLAEIVVTCHGNPVPPTANEERETAIRHRVAPMRRYTTGGDNLRRFTRDEMNER